MININIEKKLLNTTLRVYLNIEKGKFISIYGKSGAGKTTLLKMIAGLLNPDKGVISVNNQYWFNSERKVNLKPQKRKVGFVFQETALFPNMTALQNIEFAMEKKDKAFLEKIIDTLHIRPFINQNVQTLSGGQKQKVAIARAVARKPEILLLDEPFSALDSKTKIVLHSELMSIHKKFNMTTILVSHDKSEILKLSDEIVKIENGTISSSIKNDFSLKKQSEDTLELFGEVLEIEKVNENSYVLTVISGGIVFKIKQNKVENLNQGSEIVISLTTKNAKIIKIV